MAENNGSIDYCSVTLIVDSEVLLYRVLWAKHYYTVHHTVMDVYMHQYVYRTSHHKQPK